MRRIVAVLLLCACLLPRSAVADDDVAKAREHFRRGTRAYDLGRYVEAAREYESAFEAKEDPALLFNIAQAYRLGGDYANAMRAYKSYLRRVPSATNRVEVEAKIAELQKIIDQQQRAKEGPPDGLQSGQILSPRAPLTTARAPQATTPVTVELRADTPAPKPIYKRWWLWTTVAGVAAAGLAVGLGVGLAPGPSAPATETDGGTFKPFGG